MCQGIFHMSDVKRGQNNLKSIKNDDMDLRSILLPLDDFKYIRTQINSDQILSFSSFFASLSFEKRIHQGSKVKHKYPYRELFVSLSSISFYGHETTLLNIISSIFPTSPLQLSVLFHSSRLWIRVARLKAFA